VVRPPVLVVRDLPDTFHPTHLTVPSDDPILDVVLAFLLDGRRDRAQDLLAIRGVDLVLEGFERSRERARLETMNRLELRRPRDLAGRHRVVPGPQAAGPERGAQMARRQLRLAAEGALAFEERGLLPLRTTPLSDVPEYHHDAGRLPIPASDGGGTVRNRYLPAVPREEQRVIGQARDATLAKHTVDRALGGFARVLFDDD
jgi:hypothetical protein